MLVFFRHAIAIAIVLPFNHVCWNDIDDNTSKNKLHSNDVIIKKSSAEKFQLNSWKWLMRVCVRVRVWGLYVSTPSSSRHHCRTLFIIISLFTLLKKSFLSLFLFQSPAHSLSPRACVPLVICDEKNEYEKMNKKKKKKRQKQAA